MNSSNTIHNNHLKWVNRHASVTLHTFACITEFFTRLDYIQLHLTSHTNEPLKDCKRYTTNIQNQISNLKGEFRKNQIKSTKFSIKTRAFDEIESFNALPASPYFFIKSSRLSLQALLIMVGRVFPQNVCRGIVMCGSYYYPNFKRALKKLTMRIKSISLKNNKLKSLTKTIFQNKII